MARTRYTHRPNGFLTVDEIRTIFFSWVQSRKNDGAFYIRMDDPEIYPRKFYDQTMADLSWLGINWDLPDEKITQGVPGHIKPCSESAVMYQSSYQDEWLTIPGVVYRSLRGFDYMGVLHKLVREGLAYDCFLTKKEAETQNHRDLTNAQKCQYWSKGKRQGIRLNVPAIFDRFKEVTFEDKLVGQIKVTPKDKVDCLLSRPDGGFTSFFSAAIDDAALGITHVIRPIDRVGMTKYQSILMKAMGVTQPIYAHLDTSRVSSTQMPTIKSLRDQGLTPDQVLGWIFYARQEKMLTLAEFMETFDFENLTFSDVLLEGEKLALQ